METRHPVQQNNRGFPHTDRSPLAAAVADAVDAHDVIVLLPRHWSYPEREIATAHAVLGETDILSDTGCRTVLLGPGVEAGRGKQAWRGRINVGGQSLSLALLRGGASDG
ncbi:hypothetical protein [Streptomyces sp. NPDC049590]|uniref:hypothetical protein n=1 Tax=Streptomyces sp. NPDC049590 TaxID=3154834 RepID=UPI00341B19A6